MEQLCLNFTIVILNFMYGCRIVMVQRDGDSKLTEEVAKFNVGQDAPYRMKMHPSGKSIVISLATGGIKVVQITTSDNEALPVLSWPSPSVMSAAEKCSSFLGVIKCMAFSSDGTLLALGTEDGKVHIISWPTLKRQGELDVSKDRRKAVRNVDFSSAHSDGIVLAADESGSCSLWNMEDMQMLCLLEKPSDIPRLSLFRCVSTIDHKGIALYAAGNSKGNGYIVRWRQTDDGALILDCVRKVIASPISGFELSHNGAKIAVVTPDADQCLVSTESLKTEKHVKGAHMTFATAVAFTPDDSAIVSVSADASATLTNVSQERAFGGISALILFVCFVTMMAILIHVSRQYIESYPDIVLCMLDYLPEWARQALQSQAKRAS